MRFLLIPLAATAMLLFSAQDPVWAEGKKSGHDTRNTSTQGNSGKTNTNANPDNEGQTTTTTKGPKGQLDKGNTDCNNCESTVTNRPGKNK